MGVPTANESYRRADYRYRAHRGHRADVEAGGARASQHQCNERRLKSEDQPDTQTAREQRGEHPLVGCEPGAHSENAAPPIK